MNSKKGGKQLKRFIVLLISILVIAVLNACSSKTSLDLTDKEVSIIKDKEKTGAMTLQQGKQAGKEVVATSLYYTFSIKNKGSKKIGRAIPSEPSEALKVKIEPNKKLLTVSKEVMGFNIFNPTEYNNSGLGYGHSFVGVIEPNSEGKFIIYYELGINEETKEVFHTPPKEQLEKLRDNALDATLIVLSGNEEIARFDLSKKE